jgi:hypothetical protein
MGQFNPDDWNFPPKPKWMRWMTYEIIGLPAAGPKLELVA